jgi:hypothetical protein
MGNLIKNFNNRRISNNTNTPFINNFIQLALTKRLPFNPKPIKQPLPFRPFRPFRPIQPPQPQTPPPQTQTPTTQPPPQIENMPQIIPTDLMNRFPFIPFQPQPFNDFDNLDFTMRDFTYTPSNLDFSQPTIPRFNYYTDRFGMPQIIPTELINRFPRIRFKLL